MIFKMYLTHGGAEKTQTRTCSAWRTRTTLLTPSPRFDTWQNSNYCKVFNHHTQAQLWKVERVLHSHKQTTTIETKNGNNQTWIGFACCNPLPIWIGKLYKSAECAGHHPPTKKGSVKTGNSRGTKQHQNQTGKRLKDGLFVNSSSFHPTCFCSSDNTICSRQKGLIYEINSLVGFDVPD